jgi:hypothetical protein
VQCADGRVLESRTTPSPQCDEQLSSLEKTTKEERAVAWCVREDCRSKQGGVAVSVSLWRAVFVQYM